MLSRILTRQHAAVQVSAESIAAAALAAAKAAAAGTGHGQVAISETRRFAGKDIQVTCLPFQLLLAALPEH
jgi:uncharacterized phosphosugar-binding protein